MLHKNLKKMKKTLEKEGKVLEAAEYNFFPQTYYVPSEYGLFVEEFKKEEGVVWIMKPVRRCMLYITCRSGVRRVRASSCLTNLVRLVSGARYA